jgi:hypothetical protein
MEKYSEMYKESMTKEEFDSVIQKVSQSSSDVVRTEYSGKIKELETKIPKEKSPEEMALEERMNLIVEKEKQFKLIDVLESNQLPKSLAKYLKDSEDLETTIKELSEIFSQSTLNNSFKPNGHKQTETTLNKSQILKMGYLEREKFAKENPTLYIALMGKK